MRVTVCGVCVCVGGGGLNKTVRFHHQNHSFINDG